MGSHWKILRGVPQLAQSFPASHWLLQWDQSGGGWEQCRGMSGQWVGPRLFLSVWFHRLPLSACLLGPSHTSPLVVLSSEASFYHRTCAWKATSPDTKCLPLSPSSGLCSELISLRSSLPTLFKTLSPYPSLPLFLLCIYHHFSPSSREWAPLGAHLFTAAFLTPTPWPGTQIWSECPPGSAVSWQWFASRGTHLREHSMPRGQPFCPSVVCLYSSVSSVRCPSVEGTICCCVWPGTLISSHHFL
jgi:hypothetical protein